MTRFIIGFIILVLVVVLAALFAEWTLHCPDCPEPVVDIVYYPAYMADNHWLVDYDTLDSIFVLNRLLEADTDSIFWDEVEHRATEAAAAWLGAMRVDTNKVIIYADPVVVFDPDSAFAKSYQWHSTAYVTYPLSDSIAVLCRKLIFCNTANNDFVFQVDSLNKRLDWFGEQKIYLPNPCSGMVSIAAVDSFHRACHAVWHIGTTGYTFTVYEKDWRAWLKARGL